MVPILRRGRFSDKCLPRLFSGNQVDITCYLAEHKTLIPLHQCCALSTLGCAAMSSHAVVLQVKRLFKELKVDFLAVELDEVGKLPAHLHTTCIFCAAPLCCFRILAVMLNRCAWYCGVFHLAFGVAKMAGPCHLSFASISHNPKSI